MINKLKIFSCSFIFYLARMATSKEKINLNNSEISKIICLFYVIWRLKARWWRVDPSGLPTCERGVKRMFHHSKLSKLLSLVSI